MNIVKLIDYIILKVNIIKEDVMKVIEEVKEYKFVFVCINLIWVKLVVDELVGYDVDVCIVIGFLLGVSIIEIKVFEIKDVIVKGVIEVDMVINVGVLKDGDNEFVEKDIYEVV